MRRDKREPAVPSCIAAACNQWRCGSCAFTNVDADFHCRKCGNPSWSDNTASKSNARSTANERRDDTDSRKSNVADPKDDVWTCVQCTLTNQSNSRVCAACSKPRLPTRQHEDTVAVTARREPPGGKAAGGFRIVRLWIPSGRSTTDGTSSEQWAPEDCALPTWQCDRCGAENYPWNVICNACNSTQQ